jgi:hypothetical protein
VDLGPESLIDLLHDSVARYFVSGRDGVSAISALLKGPEESVIIPCLTLARGVAEAAGYVDYLCEADLSHRQAVGRYLHLTIVSANSRAKAYSDVPQVGATEERDGWRQRAAAHGFDLGQKRNVDEFALSRTNAADRGLFLDEYPSFRAVARSYLGAAVHGDGHATAPLFVVRTEGGQPRPRFRREPADRLALWISARSLLGACLAIRRWACPDDADSNPTELIAAGQNVLTAWRIESEG